MTEIIKTKKRDYQFNGPVNSSDYNARIEENYKDLVYLYNKSNSLDVKLKQTFERVIKDQRFLSLAIQDLSDRISALEAVSNSISIHSFNQLDYATFAGTEYAILSTELLSFDPTYNVITLPKINSGSYSKLKIGSPGSGQVISDYIKFAVQPTAVSVDSAGAIIDTTPIHNCILDSPDKIWKRNVITESTGLGGAGLYLYANVAPEISGSSRANMIKINPYPSFGSDITSIEFTQKPNPTLSEKDGWIPLNYRSYYNGESDAVGKVAPGGWTTTGSDYILNSGPVAFAFPELDITAIRIALRQRNYFTELGKYIYTYGLSDLDIRYDKYLTSGKMIIKYTPPDGSIIYDVTNVTPKIYNVPQSLISTAFSYRVIYPDGDGYALSSNPGGSNYVWIEVTLNMLDDKTAPVLSDLIIQYE
jgi:hypothetical protein